ncbi:MAG: SH3 domain-containing protein [Thermomicrobiales bacterium]
MGTAWKLILLFCVGCLLTVVVGLVMTERPDRWTLPDWDDPDQTGETAWVDTDALNLRSGPSTNADILGVLGMGTEISVTGDAVDGFVPVMADGVRAWLAVDYLAWSEAPLSDFDLLPDVAEAAAAEPEPESETATGASDNPNVEVDAPALPTGEHWIDVDRGSAMVTLYIGATAQGSFQGKIGRDPSDDGFYSTAVGTYFIYSKNPGLTSTPFVDDVYMTEFVGFDPERHNGFHSPIRDASGELLPSQNATTMGCVRLDEEAARDLYAFAFIGMRVEVHN